MIEAGRIEVNGQRAQLGERAMPTDSIRIDGRSVEVEAERPEAARLLIYHKPVGEIVTRDDPQGRPTVFAHLPELKGARWTAVGRLDFNTSGLLLFTNSGELAHRLMHPSFGLQREYLARVQGSLGEEQLRQLREGVLLDDGMARFDRIELHASSEAANRWYRVVIGEGRFREVRRLFEAAGARVSRLVRVRYGPVRLPRSLRAGHWQELDSEEVKAVAKAPSDALQRIARKPKIG